MGVQPGMPFHLDGNLKLRTRYTPLSSLKLKPNSHNIVSMTRLKLGLSVQRRTENIG
jgi:hypothetical protein